MLIEIGTPQIDPRHNRRQLDFFRAFAQYPDRAMLAQEKLHSSRIAILGLGGTGTEFLRLMVAAGVHHFLLVDHDRVEQSNLNRQTIYTPDDVGKAKVAVARRYVEERCTSARCETEHATVDAGERFVERLCSYAPDLVFIAVDEPPETIVRDLTSALSEVDLPFLSASVGIRRGFVFAPNSGPGPHVSVCGTSASLGTTNAMVSARASHVAIQFLTGLEMPFELVDA
ncbi:ThiF family adenylyltransferase [Curtobacterium sp. 'Ferrero']|uniref:ThiF family adenylyltransferase n=1 Tax=Curtobacterium sp. 'Ferrero' TaxID=2033654 RepID=UPI001596E638|nr:ThiF family adenylyltransferase [Curtobacterium sp. 'Ferrero']